MYCVPFTACVWSSSISEGGVRSLFALGTLSVCGIRSPNTPVCYPNAAFGLVNTMFGEYISTPIR